MSFKSNIFNFSATLLHEFNTFLYNLLHVLKNLISAVLFVVPVFLIMSMLLIHPEYRYNHSRIALCIFSSLVIPHSCNKIIPYIWQNLLTVIYKSIFLYLSSYHQLSNKHYIFIITILYPK